MSSDKLHKLIAEKLQERLQRMNLSRNDLRQGTDLVRTGLVNSMEFVELVADLETELGVQLDYDKELEREGFTTFRGLAETFQRYLDEQV